VRHVAKVYPSGTEALRDINLRFPRGQLTTLLGPSGCGKTTTLRCVAGLEEVDGGSISIGDEVVSTAQGSVPSERRQIGMVFQSYAVWPHLTVFENVAFPLRLQKLSKEVIARKVEATLDLVGLGGFGGRGAHQLSGGQLQRVALARAVVAEPKVLLFDEPLSNLDAALRERMRFELRQLQQKLGITSIYVTHDQQEAMVVADRIALMQDGRIIQVDRPDVIYNTPASLFAARFIGNANVVPGIVTAVGAETRVKLRDGPELVSNSNGVAVGDAVHVVFRPEQVRVGEPGSAAAVNRMEGVIGGNVFLGNVSDLVLSVGKLEIRSQISPPVAWQANAPVSVSIPADAVRVLDARSSGLQGGS
jgi:ABC-type Fe3+/spermidine/putrescine transport system ATPase subunit